MKRGYNHKSYRLFKKAGGIVRDKCSPDFASIFGKAFGVLGKLIAFLFTYLIAKPVHWITFAVVGFFYNKKSDSPYKGSVLYTFFSVLLMFMVAGFLKNFL